MKSILISNIKWSEELNGLPKNIVLKVEDSVLDLSDKAIKKHLSKTLNNDYGYSHVKWESYQVLELEEVTETYNLILDAEDISEFNVSESRVIEYANARLEANPEEKEDWTLPLTLEEAINVIKSFDEEVQIYFDGNKNKEYYYFLLTEHNGIIKKDTNHTRLFEYMQEHKDQLFERPYGIFEYRKVDGKHTYGGLNLTVSDYHDNERARLYNQLKEHKIKW